MSGPIRLIDKCREAVADANRRWADSTGEVEPPLCANEWQLINHLAKWAYDEGLIDRIVYKGEAARLLSELPPAAKRDVWGEALWYLDTTLPERFHPVTKAVPETGPEFVAWLDRVASAAGGRIGDLMRNWKWRRAKDCPGLVADFSKWGRLDIAEAYAEARRIMNFTEGMVVEIGPQGEILTTAEEILA
jgi:hypothetical protein